MKYRTNHPVTDCRIYFNRGDGKCLFCYNDLLAHDQLDGQLSIEDAEAAASDV